jgi:hypothetical protein
LFGRCFGWLGSGLLLLLNLAGSFLLTWLLNLDLLTLDLFLLCLFSFLLLDHNAVVTRDDKHNNKDQPDIKLNIVESAVL